LEKASARVTELAVKRFEAQLLKTQSIQFDIQQKIIQTENKINFLVGRLPQPVERSPQSILDVEPTAMKVGIPAQLIQQRPDIRQAEQEMAAADLDVKVAKAAFYPSLTISGDLGLRAFTLANILETPTSLLYALTGDVAGPLLNRRAITAEYLNANAKQIQAMFRYERAVLSAFAEVANQVAGMKNLGESLGLRKDQVSALTESVTIAGTLFTAGRADYTEVLLTQRDALESRFELIETKLNQMRTVVGLYRSLGGGWQ
jgi:outer membrane protein TolC